MTERAGVGFKYFIIGFVALLIITLIVAWQIATPQWRDAEIKWSSVLDDSTVLHVCVEGGQDDDARVVADETDSEVRLIGSVKYQHWGFENRTSIAVSYIVEVRLDTPLNGRTVIDQYGSLVPLR